MRLSILTAVYVISRLHGKPPELRANAKLLMDCFDSLRIGATEYWKPREFGGLTHYPEAWSADERRLVLLAFRHCCQQCGDCDYSRHEHMHDPTPAELASIHRKLRVAAG